MRLFLKIRKLPLYGRAHRASKPHSKGTSSDRPAKNEEREGSKTPDLLYLLQGANDFSRLVFSDSEALFKSLARRQKPHTLFITCADSRVSPEMITQTRPGELFVCRNIGNIVPGYGEMLGGVSAVVEYAVLALDVRQIVICGHSDCGAMKGLASGATIADEMPTVHAWLRNAEAARSVVMARKLREESMSRRWSRKTCA